MTDRIPPIRCSVCHRPCPAGDTWMWVDMLVARDAAAALQARDALPADEHFVDRLSRIANRQADPIACWRFGHSKCGPDYMGIYDVELPGTYRALLGWLVELLATRWLAGTDITAVLHEAATLTGRFAPADPTAAETPS